MRFISMLVVLAACGTPDPIVNINVLPAEPVVITETVTNTITNTVTVTAVDADGDLFPAEVDCDDSNPDVHPGASEICNENGIDYDCDGLVGLDDSDLPHIVYHDDLDGDGYGDNSGHVNCYGYVDPNAVLNDEDCDDGRADTYPDADEVPYDGFDQDCDGLIDNCGSLERRLHDLDGDGYGDPNNYELVDVCNAWLPGLTIWQVGMDDCDDTEASANPLGIEICGDGLDQDCDGSDLACPICGVSATTIDNADVVTDVVPVLELSNTPLDIEVMPGEDVVIEFTLSSLNGCSGYTIRGLSVGLSDMDDASWIETMTDEYHPATLENVTDGLLYDPHSVDWAGFGLDQGVITSGGTTYAWETPEGVSQLPDNDTIDIPSLSVTGEEVKTFRFIWTGSDVASLGTTIEFEIVLEWNTLNGDQISASGYDHEPVVVNVTIL